MHTTRKAALKAVERYYETGKPCKYGHRSKRLTRSGACVECIRSRLLQETRTFSQQLREKEACTHAS
jgi:hypothetical protein